MHVDLLLEISANGIITAIMISAPILILALVAGLVVSIFQAATQINDASIAFIPKIAASIAALLLFGHWMLSEMAAFSTYVMNQIPNVTR